MNLDGIRQKIGADSLEYIKIEGLKQACGGCARNFCTACFTGNGGYVREKKDVFE
jgi:amidophosphoribosyltransferase